MSSVIINKLVQYAKIIKNSFIQQYPKIQFKI